MKNMTLGAFALASALALASTPGHALSFNYSFTDLDGFVPGTVTGHIDGLQDNATGPATAVFIDSAPSVFNLPHTPFSVPVTDPGGTFTVTSGVIDKAIFLSEFGVSPSSPIYALFMDGVIPEVAGSLDIAGTNILTQGFVSFSQVPGPVAGAGLPGLILASGGLLILGWWRRRRQLVA
jgi:hypothetical protein